MVIEAVDDSRGDREVIEDESDKVFALLSQVQQFRESEVLVRFQFRVRNSREERFGVEGERL